MKTTKHKRGVAVAGQVDRVGRSKVSKRTNFDAPFIDASFDHLRGVMELMPEYSQIPDEFKSDRNPWHLWQTEWFFSGLKKIPAPKPGIDIKKAMRHLYEIQSSWLPKHEHKSAAVAFLASKWFELDDLTEAA